MISHYSVIPSPNSSTVVTEVYNTLLSFHQLIENSDAVILFDNEALFNACGKLNIQNPQLKDINQLVATTMSNISSTCRFPGCQLNTDYRKLCVNLVPFPRMHFLLPGIAPLQPTNSPKKYSVHEILEETLKFKNMLVSENPKLQGVYTAGITLRGDFSQCEVEKVLRNIRAQSRCWLQEWTKYSTCPVTPPGCSAVSTVLANCSAVNGILRRTVDQFRTFFYRRAYVWHYTGEGMDEMEFIEAECNVTDLIQETGDMLPPSYYEEEVDL